MNTSLDVERVMEYKFEYYDDVFENLKKNAKNEIKPEVDALVDSLIEELIQQKDKYKKIKQENPVLNERLALEIHEKWLDFEKLVDKKLQRLRKRASAVIG